MCLHISWMRQLEARSAVGIPMDGGLHISGLVHWNSCRVWADTLHASSSSLHTWQLFWWLSFWENWLSLVISQRHNLELWILPWRSGTYKFVAALEFHFSNSLAGLSSDCIVAFCFLQYSYISPTSFKLPTQSWPQLCLSAAFFKRSPTVI